MLFDPCEISYSKVKSYKDCPELYRYIYMEQKRPPINAAAALGVSVHKALEAYHSRSGDLCDLMACYDEHWQSGGFENAQQQLEYYNKGRDMLERYWAIDCERESKIVCVEKKFEFLFGKFKVRGTIDRIDKRADGRLEIIEYKTGAEVKSAAAAAENLQTAMYGLGMKMGLGLTPGLVTFWFLSQGKRVTAPYSQAGEESALNEIASAGEKFLGKEFPPDVNHCPYCSLKKTCRFSIEKPQ